MFKAWCLVIAFFLVVFAPVSLGREPPQKVLEAAEAVVEIEIVGTSSLSGKHRARASGVIIRKGGYLLTCGHLFWYSDDPSSLLELRGITVISRGEGWIREFLLEDLARCVPNPAVDTERDLALLKFDEQLPGGLRLGEATLGKVWLLGYADPGELTLIQGVVRRVSDDRLLIEVDTLPLPGMSGSPVLTEEGIVVGIVIAPAGDRFVIAVPATAFRPLHAMMRCFGNLVRGGP